MKDENGKFAKISEIYSRFNEKNKDNLVAMAKRLAAVQRKDAELIKTLPPRGQGTVNNQQ